MRSNRWNLVCAVLVCAACLRPALGWWPEGHQVIAEAAVRALPADMPEWFRAASNTLASYANDADLWKDRSVPALKAQEGPEHFIDLELLKGAPLPATRKEFRALCRRLEVDPERVGMLPYAIQEWHDRLVLAFAEYRRRPDDVRIRAKILVLAGVMSHYTADAGQPLHCTVHYDGRLRADGSSPRSGVHYRVDALPGNLKLTAAEIADGLKVNGGTTAFDLVRGTLARSRARVARVYELESKLPKAPGAEAPIDADARAFGLLTARESAQLTAAVWYAAWTKSAHVKLPSWHKPYEPQAAK